jgi:hypothetical protein
MSFDTFLADLPQAIADVVKPVFPELRDCAPHAGKFDLTELKKKGLAAPSILVSILGARQTKELSGNAAPFNLSMAAYVITKDTLGLSRDVAAANMCQALLALVASNSWGLTACGSAQSVSMQPLISATTRDHGVALWAVTWTQPVMLRCDPTSEPMPITLYVGQSPNVGDANASAYVEIAGETS